MALFHARRLALRKRAEQQVSENIRPTGLAVVEQPSRVKRIFIREAMIAAGRRETFRRSALRDE